jgi:hypothetical protein
VFFAGESFDNYVTQNAVQNKGFSVLAISFVFVIIYVVCSLVALVLSSLRTKLVNRNKDYKDMFQKQMTHIEYYMR